MQLLSKDELISRINNLHVNDTIDLEDTNFIHDYIKLEEDQGEFTWCMKKSWLKGKGVGWIYPLKASDNSCIKFFKTMDGAIRNLIRDIDENWEFMTI